MGEAPEEQAAAGASAEARAALRELSGWLDDLPPDQRTAIVLKELEGMSGSEIADVLGCSERIPSCGHIWHASWMIQVCRTACPASSRIPLRTSGGRD